MTHYETLGVPLTATPAEIKRAYRRKAAAAHPDRHGGAHDAMSAVQAAYACLGDPVLRAAYDGGDEVDHHHLEREAADVVELMFGEVMEDETCVDIVGAVKHRLLEGDKFLAAGIEKQRAANKRFLRMRGRVTRNGGGANLFDTALAAKIEMLAKKERAKRIGLLAIDLLATYVDNGPALGDGEMRLRWSGLSGETR